MDEEREGESFVSHNYLGAASQATPHGRRRANSTGG